MGPENGDLLLRGEVAALPAHACSSARVLPLTPAKANSRSDWGNTGEHSCLPLSGPKAALSVTDWRSGALHFLVGTALHFFVGKYTRRPDPRAARPAGAGRVRGRGARLGRRADRPRQGGGQVRRRGSQVARGRGGKEAIDQRPSRRLRLQLLERSGSRTSDRKNRQPAPRPPMLPAELTDFDSYPAVKKFVAERLTPHFADARGMLG